MAPRSRSSSNWPACVPSVAFVSGPSLPLTRADNRLRLPRPNRHLVHINVARTKGVTHMSISRNRRQFDFESKSAAGNANTEKSPSFDLSPPTPTFEDMQSSIVSDPSYLTSTKQDSVPPRSRQQIFQELSERLATRNTKFVTAVPPNINVQPSETAPASPTSETAEASSETASSTASETTEGEGASSGDVSDLENKKITVVGDTSEASDDSDTSDTSESRQTTTSKTSKSLEIPNAEESTEASAGRSKSDNLTDSTEKQSGQTPLSYLDSISSPKATDTSKGSEKGALAEPETESETESKTDSDSNLDSNSNSKTETNPISKTVDVAGNAVEEVVSGVVETIEEVGGSVKSFVDGSDEDNNKNEDEDSGESSSGNTGDNEVDRMMIGTTPVVGAVSEAQKTVKGFGDAVKSGVREVLPNEDSDTKGQKKPLSRILLDAITEGVPCREDEEKEESDKSQIVELVDSGKVKNLTVSKLKRLLSAHNLKTSGRKSELIARLTSFARS